MCDKHIDKRCDYKVPQIMEKCAPYSIYMASPIDLNPTNDWKVRFKEMLAEYGINAVLFDPARAFHIINPININDQMSRYIEAVNTEALRTSDLVVCCLPAGVQTVGTIVEIDMCHRQGKDLLLLTDIPRGRNSYLNNRISEENWIYIESVKDEIKLEIGLSVIVQHIMNTRENLPEFITEYDKQCIDFDNKVNLKASGGVGGKYVDMGTDPVYTIHGAFYGDKTKDGD